MKFQLTLEVEVPDHIAHTMPESPDLQEEFKGLVNAAVAASVQCWSDSRIKSSEDVRAVVLTLVEDSLDPGVFHGVEAPSDPIKIQ